MASFLNDDYYKFVYAGMFWRSHSFPYQSLLLSATMFNDYCVLVHLPTTDNQKQTNNETTTDNTRQGNNIIQSDTSNSTAVVVLAVLLGLTILAVIIGAVIVYIVRKRSVLIMTQL